MASAVAGTGCSDDAVARAALMPVAAVREVLPSMLDRCLHVLALLKAKANRTRPGRSTRGSGSRVRGNGGCCLWGTV